MSIKKTEPKESSLKFSVSEINTGKLKEVKEVIRAIDHPLRKKILQFLDKKKGKSNVTELYLNFKIEQSVASQMLNILRKANLVTAERNGKEQLYSVNHETIKNLNKLATSYK